MFNSNFTTLFIIDVRIGFFREILDGELIKVKGILVRVKNAEGMLLRQITARQTNSCLFLAHLDAWPEVVIKPLESTF